MDCQRAKSLLSPLIDGELPVDERVAVLGHIESCADCRSTYDAFRSLSDVAGSLDAPLATDQWDAIEARLTERESVSPASHRRRWPSRRSLVWVGVSLAAVLLLAIWSPWRQEEHHVEVDLAPFLARFSADPESAARELRDDYANQPVEVADLGRFVGFKPIATESLPTGHSLAGCWVVRMPCCDCVQCVYTKPNGSTLVLFEHDEREPFEFGKRVAESIECGDEACRMLSFDDRLITSWDANGHHATLVGTDDLDEAAAVIRHLSKSKPPG